MADAPRAYTPEEARDLLLEVFTASATYWANLPDKTPKERCDGVVFSVLVALDGCSMDLPAFDLIVSSHPDDPEYHKALGENWFEPEQRLSFALHEHLHRFTK
jgi:hypothetical protein